MGIYVKNIKAAKKNTCSTTMDFFIIILINDWYVDKKFQPSILNRSRKKYDFPKICLTDRRADILNYRVA